MFTGSEIVEMMAFSELEPWGEGAEDGRCAALRAQIAASTQGKKRKAFRIRNFLPFDRDHKIARPKSIGELTDILKNAFLGGGKG